MYRIYYDDGQNAFRTQEVETLEEVTAFKELWTYRRLDGSIGCMIWKIEKVEIIE